MLKAGDQITLPGNEEFPSVCMTITEPRIAHGSFSVVHKAVLHNTCKYVAFKESTRPLNPPIFQISDPYIAPILYVGKSAFCTIVEEWVYGRTIFDIARNRDFSNKPSLPIVKAIIEAIQHVASEYQIYHGDLTPCNVIIRNNREGPSAVLIDFDPWYQIDQRGEVNASDISGSIPFLPPEYICGCLSFNAEKALAYSAGCIIYYYLYGYPPYCQDLPQKFVHRLMFGRNHPHEIVKERQQFLDYQYWKSCLKQEVQLIQNTNSSVDYLIKSMLSKEPDERATISEALQLLKGKELE